MKNSITTSNENGNRINQSSFNGFLAKFLSWAKTLPAACSYACHR